MNGFDVRAGLATPGHKNPEESTLLFKSVNLAWVTEWVYFRLRYSRNNKFYDIFDAPSHIIKEKKILIGLGLFSLKHLLIITYKGPVS